MKIIKKIFIIMVFFTFFVKIDVYASNNNFMNIKNTFYGNMSNEKGIILKWSKVSKSKGYVIYRNNKKIATIKSNKIKVILTKKLRQEKSIHTKSLLIRKLRERRP